MEFDIMAQVFDVIFGRELGNIRNEDIPK